MPLIFFPSRDWRWEHCAPYVRRSERF